MNKNVGNLVNLLREDLRLFLSVSLGVFLFVLFFQPFPIDHFDFNNSLLFVFGFGIIFFLWLVIVRTVLRWLIQRSYPYDPIEALPSYITSFTILVLNTVAFAFYLHFIGSVELTFFIIFKVTLIGLGPLAILRLYDVMNRLSHENQSLVIDKKVLQTRIEKYEEDYLSKSIEFVSEDAAGNLSLLITDIVFIRSADNYVEIVFKEGEEFKKRLIRATMKNIEQQIKQYSNFIRCHRICIINTHYIEKLNKDYTSYWLSISGINEKIPVSRQYLLKIKETL